MAFESHARIALVTGAAMGIGAAITEQLARDGMTVLVSDINMEEAEKTAGKFREGGCRPKPCNLMSDSLPRLRLRLIKLQRRTDAAMWS